ncbi:hypothetical protein D3C72_2164880 [compost metagenome]
MSNRFIRNFDNDSSDDIDKYNFDNDPEYRGNDFWFTDMFLDPVHQILEEMCFKRH